MDIEIALNLLASMKTEVRIIYKPIPIPYSRANDRK